MSDIVPSVPVEYRPTLAHGDIRPITRGIVLHSTRGPTRPRENESLIDTLHREYNVAVAYMQNVANEVSPHFCVGSKIVARMVSDRIIAWHAQEHNKTHLGIEIAQPAYQPPFVEFQYVATASICGLWCVKYDIEPRHVVNDDASGIIGHEETDQGRRDKKSDPGYRWDWDKFIPMVKEVVAKVTDKQIASVVKCTEVVDKTNVRLLQAIADLEKITGVTDLSAELKALRALYHDYGVAYPRQNVGLP